MDRKYVIFREPHNSIQTRFWSGPITPVGKPSETVDRERALEFDTARAAYEAAGHTGILNYWRVGKR